MVQNSKESKTWQKLVAPKVQIFKRAKPAPKRITKLLRNLKGGNA